MELTFISIHDLSLDARLLYVSTSIEDILGYTAEEVVGRSSWDFFHPDEIPFAQAVHDDSIRLDKAAVLNYCRIRDKAGYWIGCECVFTVVHDCLVASTSIYRRDRQSEMRARDAPVIRQLFSSSPRDPRYHMLQYISSKFTSRLHRPINEPRAALFLNRFSRTLTIMYATDGLADLLQTRNDQLIGKSFYFCIQENCLRDAVKCLESAKANDSIAYLRFWFRDPCQDDQPMNYEDDCMTDGHTSGEESEGGVHIDEVINCDEHLQSTYNRKLGISSAEVKQEVADPAFLHADSPDPASRSSSNNSGEEGLDSREIIFDQPEIGSRSTSSSVSTPDEFPLPRGCRIPENSIELEAVVSCTSDGLVVVLRGARPVSPAMTYHDSESIKHPYTNGLFASPWASEPIMPTRRTEPEAAGLQDMPTTNPTPPYAQNPEFVATQDAAQEMLMSSIRDTVAFAWSLTGINGSLAQYGQGAPVGEAQPERLQIWDACPSSQYLEGPVQGYLDTPQDMFPDHTLPDYPELATETSMQSIQ